MNVSIFYFANKGNKPEGNELVVVSVPTERNTSEGSEFLDDALRMKEQPWVYTEEGSEPGSPISV